MRLTLMCGAWAAAESLRVLDMPAPQILDLIANPAQWPSELCSSEQEKLAGTGFLCAQYREDAPTRDEKYLDPASETEFLAYDLDAMAAEHVNVLRAALVDYSCVVYSTFKHTPEAPRLRVLIELAKPLSTAGPEPYKTVYVAVARFFGIDYDPQTANPGRFFLGPQHNPQNVNDTVRQRYRGAPLDISRISLDAPATVPQDLPGSIYRPDKKDLKKLAEALKKRGNAAGNAIESLLSDHPIAAPGGVHDTLTRLAMALLYRWRDLDSEWFSEAYLKNNLAEIAPGIERWPHRLQDWQKAIDTGRAKIAEGDAERAAVLPADTAAFNALDISWAKGLKGALVVSHGSAYYVLSPRDRRYFGPFKSAQVPTAFREYLTGLPGVSEMSGGPTPGLKSATRLNHEYGRTIEAVHYYAYPPKRCFSVAENAIKLPAYNWIDWPPVFHPIADELLTIIGGDSAMNLGAYLYKFRDLNRPLPALTLIGARGVWKSKICQTLARFWGNRDFSMACSPAQVLLRFSAPLLDNPVIWSDEELAREHGDKAIPERYRRSISERAHAIERKGVDPVTLYTATRHVISVNEEEKVFSSEIDVASIEATLQRFFVLRIDGDKIARFEKRWYGTPEMERLREGSSLLEHVMWIEKNAVFESMGRFWIDTGAESDLLWRARFGDEVLNHCLHTAIEAVFGELKMSRPGQFERLPLICDKGLLKLSPARVYDCWPVSGKLRRPSISWIGRVLAKAGLKADPFERANNSKFNGWVVKTDVLRSFIDYLDKWSWREFEAACETVFGSVPE